jgi:hypothetical protein
MHAHRCHADPKGDALDILDQGVAHGVGHKGQLNRLIQYVNNADLNKGVSVERPGGQPPGPPGIFEPH